MLRALAHLVNVKVNGRIALVFEVIRHFPHALGDGVLGVQPECRSAHYASRVVKQTAYLGISARAAAHELVRNATHGFGLRKRPGHSVVIEISDFAASEIGERGKTRLRRKIRRKRRVAPYAAVVNARHRHFAVRVRCGKSRKFAHVCDRARVKRVGRYDVAFFHLQGCRSARERYERALFHGDRDLLCFRGIGRRVARSVIEHTVVIGTVAYIRVFKRHFGVYFYGRLFFGYVGLAATRRKDKNSRRKHAGDYR